MPIAGLTDRVPSFKELGRLRLGIPKAQAAQGGPKEISYFRADFRPDAGDAAAAFLATYDAQPTEINIRIPFPQIDRCWDAFYMVYNKTGLLGMADGTRWLYLRHNQTSKLLVKDGIPQEVTPTMPRDEIGMPYMPFDKSVPVYSYKSQKGVDVAVYARPEGRLKVLIPELKRAGYVLVVTHSVYNIMKISEQLAAISELGKQINIPLPMIPMVLSRRKESISVAIDGKKAMQEKYLLNIEIHPDWMAAQLDYVNQLMPGKVPAIAAPVPLPALPSGQLPDEREVMEDGYIQDEWGNEPDELGYTEPAAKLEPQPTQPAQPAQPSGVMSLETAKDVKTSQGKRYGDMERDELTHVINGIQKALSAPDLTPDRRDELTFKRDAALTILQSGERPYSPDELRERLIARAKTHTKAPTEKQVQLTAMLMRDALGGDDKRHLVTKYLTGHESLKDCGVMVNAMLDWLKPVQDSGGAYTVDPLAGKELTAAYNQALKDAGQSEFTL